MPLAGPIDDLSDRPIVRPPDQPWSAEVNQQTLPPRPSRRWGSISRSSLRGRSGGTEPPSPKYHVVRSAIQAVHKGSRK